jgi:hypothetical protein
MVAESTCECGWRLVMGWESAGGKEGGRVAATAEGVGGTEGNKIALTRVLTPSSFSFPQPANLGRRCHFSSPPVTGRCRQSPAATAGGQIRKRREKGRAYLVDARCR